ncbi:MAG TPA: antibiotic biosynthesis monooxygenase [Ktedonobacteraceae bacterium]|nr:antibiotic biosynthesis monooxygenase [Ktedonobacteraceae bacterium]
MYARVTTVQVQPGKIDDGIQIFRDAVLPAAQQQPGFKGVLQLVDRSNNKSIGITLWETEDDMKAGEASGYYQQQIAKVAPLLAAQPVRETYEVSMRE